MGNTAASELKGGVRCLLLVATVLVMTSWLFSNLSVTGKVHAQSAATQDPLPEAPNRTLVVSKCTQCHGTQMFSTQRHTSKDWDQIISQMQTKGLVLSDDEYDKVLSYLSTNLAPVAITVNVNTTSASELQKALDLTDKEANAILKARAAHGNFKDWHEVASVDGVDPKKIEAKKDMLSF